MSEVVAITGAASGLGAALRSQLEASGTTVVGVDLADADIDADLATPEGRRAATAGILDRVGGRLDGLALCAGIGPPRDPQQMVAVNYFGAVTLLDGLLPALVTNAPASVVLISSNSITLAPIDQRVLEPCLAGEEDAARTAARGVDPSTVYATTKLAIARTVRRRARELGALGVRLNAVAPGPFESALLRATRADPHLGPLVDALPAPLQRRATAHDIASVVAFMLSPNASNVHGTLLFADGGIDATISPERVP